MPQIWTVFRDFHQIPRRTFFRVRYARAKVKKAFLLFSVALLIGMRAFFKDSRSPMKVQKGNGIFSNYLRPIGDLHGADLLVNTSKCQIPDIDIWDPQVRPLLGPFTKKSCGNNGTTSGFGGLTFVRKQVVVINETILKSNRLQLTDIDCCYQTISRVLQRKTSYNRNADSKIQFSDKCYPMPNWTTAPHSGFIRVTCGLQRFLWEEKIYSAFHLLATFNSTGHRDLSTKLEYWRQNPDLRRPPNVLLIGIHSTSRIHFRRSMPRSTDLLEKLFGAVEMKGYTKVADNTFPNFVPLMTSLSEKELITLCQQNTWSALDDCPFLWKDFSARNYLTGHLEDCPKLQIFNSQKTGFVEPPADIYIRPWMLAAYEDLLAAHCLGSQRPDEVLLQYIVDLVELAESHRIPYFITAWITELTHGTRNDLHNMDDPLGSALWRLQERDFSTNSVLLVMGDQGYRFFPVRRSLSGWYENKLPVLWISLPDRIRTQNPSWMTALRHNSQQLTTPFEVHYTLKDIQNLGLGRTLNKTLERNRTYSLFQKIPERTCSGARIPFQHCPCAAPEELEDRDVAKWAAEVVLGELNKGQVATSCVELELGDITTFAKLAGATSTKYDSAFLFVVGFNATPGIAVEAMMSYEEKWKSFEIVNLQRTNRIDRIANQSCVPCDAFSAWCYCEVNWFSPFYIYDMFNKFKSCGVS